MKTIIVLLFLVSCASKPQYCREEFEIEDMVTLLECVGEKKAAEEFKNDPKIRKMPRCEDKLSMND